MFFLAQFDAIRQYLNAMSKSFMVMIVSIIATIFHLVWCYLFLAVFKMDIVGVSIATSITYFMQFLAISIYCSKSKSLRKSFFLPDKDTFKKLNDYLRLAIPSTFLLLFDWWSFELLAVFAGFISVEVTGAHIIILNAFFLFIMFPLGTLIASTVLVGKSMG